MPYKNQTQYQQPVNNTYPPTTAQNTLAQQNQQNISTNQGAQQQEQKGATIKIIAKFLFITESRSKQTGQVMQGIDKNGKQWKKFDVVFNKPGSQQNKIFGVFNDLSGTSLRLNQLVSGTDYELIYEQGVQQVKANRLFWVGVPTGEPKEPVKSVNPPSVYVPPAIKQVVNVLPEEQQLWDLGKKEFAFETLKEWLIIGYYSGIFNDKSRAEAVYHILSQE